MLSLGMIAAIAVLQGVVYLTPSDHVNLASTNIVISDVVSPDGIDEAVYKRVAGKVIATLPEGHTKIDLPRDTLANLVRRRVPLFSDIDTIDGQGAIHFESGISQQVNNKQCKMTIGALEQGTVVLARHLMSVSCRAGAEMAPVRYDRLTGVLRTKTKISAQTYLGRVEAAEREFADTGDELVLMVKMGPVRVERPVWALQPALGADHIFVQDKNGTLMRVPVMNASGEIQNARMDK